MSKKQSSLPFCGLSRWGTLKPFIPVSRETWRKRVRAGHAPQPIRLSPRCTVWSNEDIHRWLSDPVGYQPEAGEQLISQGDNHD